MTTTRVPAPRSRHLMSGIQSTALSTVAAGVGSVIRIPLTIAAIGVSGYGALSTICALFGWIFFMAAGARNAGAALAVSPGHEDEDPATTASSVARATFRHAAPVLGLLLVLVAVLPWHTLVDPDHTMSRPLLEAVLFASIAIGLVSVPGAALLGVVTTRGRFRDQNLAVIAGIAVTTALAVAAFAVGAGPGWFTLIWVASLAVPALPVALWFPKKASGRRQTLRQDVGNMSGSSLWIAAGQQFSSGFDLVIISVILGSEAAAAYGLVSRIAQLALTPVIGAMPVLTQSAGRARVSGRARSRRAARSLNLLVGSLQCAGIVLFVALGGWACRLLSSGHISPSMSLLLASGGWAVTDTARRCLMSASATSHGLRHWRRANLGFALPNLALSVLLTKFVGVSGPMLASLIAVGAMVVVAAWSLRGELGEAFGR